MKNLIKKLNNIEDSYYDFVLAISEYASKKKSRYETVLNYLETNPSAKTEDVILFVSKQHDFKEDASYSQVS